MFIEGDGAGRQTSRRMDGLPDKAPVIGLRLRALRLAHGVEVAADFAKQCGITPQAWNNWERGRQVPSLEQVSKIRQHTGATTDFVYYGDLSGVPHALATRIRAELAKLSAMAPKRA